MSGDPTSDPFREARSDGGILLAAFGEEIIPMILTHAGVRHAARNWQTFSSDAPMRVPIPSEEAVRSVRQLPIEADPPLHTAMRDLLKPVFLRPVTPAYIAQLDTLVSSLVDAATALPEIEIVRDFALPLQSHALALLLGMPEEVAHEWISWGTHVFHGGGDGSAKGAVVDRYIRHALEDGRRKGGEDFFAMLHRARIEGRALTNEEMVGIANLVFAGGRDTVIHCISRILAYFAINRPELDAIASDPKRTALAVEEFVRVISPLTHIGRVCPVRTDLGESKVAANARVSLCWASANRDEAVFPDPHEIRLDRMPNPHLGFGSGIHSCLGAAQARAILRSLIRNLAGRTRSITIISEQRHFEETTSYRRWTGYEALVATLEARP